MIDTLGARALLSGVNLFAPLEGTRVQTCCISFSCGVKSYINEEMTQWLVF